LLLDVHNNPGVLRRWEVPAGSPLGTAQQDKRWKELAAFSPSGERFATVVDGETVQAWNVSDGEAASPPIKVTGTVRTLVFNRDDSVLLIGTEEGQCQCWRVTSGEPAYPALKVDGRVSAAVFLPDNEHYAVGTWGSAVLLCRGSEKIAEIKAGSLVSAVDIDAKADKLLIGTAEGSLRLWDAKTREQVGQVMKHPSRIMAASFTPDGRIVASYLDGSTRLWDVRTCGEIGIPLMHSKTVTALAISRDGKWAATGSSDWKARLWNIAPASGTNAEIKRWCETLTSVRLADDGSLEVLPLKEWQRLKKELP
jgi:WD40 repeat protein